jgi:hypothetical protein
MLGIQPVDLLERESIVVARLGRAGLPLLITRPSGIAASCTAEPQQRMLEANSCDLRVKWKQRLCHGQWDDDGQQLHQLWSFHRLCSRLLQRHLTVGVINSTWRHSDPRLGSAGRARRVSVDDESHFWQEMSELAVCRG